jgi:hypothetical protein
MSLCQVACVGAPRPAAGRRIGGFTPVSLASANLPGHARQPHRERNSPNIRWRTHWRRGTAGDGKGMTSSSA